MLDLLVRVSVAGELRRDYMRARRVTRLSRASGSHSPPLRVLVVRSSWSASAYRSGILSGTVRPSLAHRVPTGGMCRPRCQVALAPCVL